MSSLKQSFYYYDLFHLILVVNSWKCKQENIDLFILAFQQKFSSIKIIIIKIIILLFLIVIILTSDKM